MELRANQQRHDLHEWLLRAVIGELLRLENEDTCRAHESRAAPKAHSTIERKPHAPHC